MPAPLRCPTCSAPLDVPPEFATTTRCTYCGAAVLLTERGGHTEAAAAQQRYSDAIQDVLRQLRAGSRIGAIAAYREHFGVGLGEAKYAVERLEAGQPGAHPAPAGGPVTGDRAAAGRGQPRAALAAAVFVVAVSAGIGVLAMRMTVRETTTTTTVSAPGAPTPASPLRGGDEKKAFAEEVLRFGSEGNGAGRFEDARTVSVDGAGRLYVADYSDGRVQVFDSAGTFLTQWILDPDMPLSDVAADRQGTVYVVQGGRIRRVDGTTGRVLGQLPTPRRFGYDDVALALDGTLWVTAFGSVLHMERDGTVLKEIAMSEAVPGGAMPSRIAVSGDGHVYVTDRMSSEIYHLDPAGRFVDRFGPGRQEGRPSPSTQDLAFDGRGRLFVSVLGQGIRVYDTQGHELGAIGDGVVFGMAFNDRDELYAAYRNDHQIVKYRLND
jgi:sugar lactone lactonase YvrE/DNA-directed RNA polymerase subunit RPC12/RpoP